MARPGKGRRDRSGSIEAAKKKQTTKKSRYSEEQIIHILREACGGRTVQVMCARQNVSQVTKLRIAIHAPSRMKMPHFKSAVYSS